MVICAEQEQTKPQPDMKREFPELTRIGAQGHPEPQVHRAAGCLEAAFRITAEYLGLTVRRAGGHMPATAPRAEGYPGLMTYEGPAVRILKAGGKARLQEAAPFRIKEGSGRTNRRMQEWQGLQADSARADAG